MTAQARIGCIGELLVEFVCSSKNGHHRKAGVYSGPFPSGAPGIFIDQAARVGAACLFLGAVGDDAFGHVILDRLIADGVDTSLVKVVPGVPTGSAFVSYNDDGSRDFVYNIALSAASHIESDPAALAALSAFQLDFMHVSGSALGSSGMRKTIMQLCKSLHVAGVKISFDPNIRKELVSDPSYFDAVKELMSMTSIFLPSDEDAAVLFPGETFAAFAPRLLATGMDHVVLKKGDQGSEAMNGAGEHVRYSARQVEVKDPTGAGDCFCATFVALIAGKQFSLKQALERANAAGALAVTQVGPMEGASHLATIEAFLAAKT